MGSLRFTDKILHSAIILSVLMANDIFHAFAMLLYMAAAATRAIDFGVANMSKGRREGSLYNSFNYVPKAEEFVPGCCL